jgi:hypothetical protein
MTSEIVEFPDRKPASGHSEDKAHAKAFRDLEDRLCDCVRMSRIAVQLMTNTRFDTQPPAQPHGGVVVDRSVRLVDGAYIEVVRPSAQRAVQLRHQLCGSLPCTRSEGARTTALCVLLFVI